MRRVPETRCGERMCFPYLQGECLKGSLDCWKQKIFGSVINIKFNEFAKWMFVKFNGKAGVVEGMSTSKPKATFFIRLGKIQKNYVCANQIFNIEFCPGNYTVNFIVTAKQDK